MALPFMAGLQLIKQAAPAALASPTGQAPRPAGAHLADALQPRQVLLILGGVEVGDAALDARDVVQLAPQHHLVVRTGRLVLVVKAA